LFFQEPPPAAPPEDSFELIDDPKMDDFNVTMPIFFKRLSHLNMPDESTANDVSTVLEGQAIKCGSSAHATLDAEALKCDIAMDTLKRLKNSKAGRTIRGSIK
jgi:hypothetical protein